LLLQFGGFDFVFLLACCLVFGVFWAFWVTSWYSHYIHVMNFVVIQKFLGILFCLVWFGFKSVFLNLFAFFQVGSCYVHIMKLRDSLVRNEPMKCVLHFC
jgi:hypothetical protein